MMSEKNREPAAGSTHRLARHGGSGHKHKHQTNGEHAGPGGAAHNSARAVCAVCVAAVAIVVERLEAEVPEKKVSEEEVTDPVRPVADKRSDGLGHLGQRRTIEYAIRSEAIQQLSVFSKAISLVIGWLWETDNRYSEAACCCERRPRGTRRPARAQRQAWG